MPGGGGEVLAPSVGTHCETDPKSGGGECRDKRAVTLKCMETGLNL